MSVIRIRKRAGFTTVRNAAIEDRRLSWEAAGLLAYLLTKPDNWQVRNEHLFSYRAAGKYKVARMLEELKEHGYLHRVRVNDKETGQITWVSDIYEDPADCPMYQKSVHGEKEETITRFTIDGSPIDGSPIDGKPVHIINTDQTNTDQTNTEGESISRNGAAGQLAAVATDGVINPLITAIASVSKNVLTLGRAEREFEEAALTLFTFDASPGDLPRFSLWWQENGYYSGKPWLRTIVDHWDDFKAGRCLKRKAAQTNGRPSPSANGRQAAQPVLAGLQEIEPGVY